MFKKSWVVGLLVLLSFFCSCKVGNSSNNSESSVEGSGNFNPEPTELSCNFVCVFDDESGELVQVEQTCNGTGPDLVEGIESFDKSLCNSAVGV